MTDKDGTPAPKPRKERMSPTMFWVNVMIIGVTGIAVFLLSISLLMPVPNEYLITGVHHAGTTHP